MKRWALCIVVLAISTTSSVMKAQDNAEELGKVHFAVSCTPTAQLQFDRAVSMPHSFWYPQGLKAFEEVTKIDPSCAMGYWVWQ